MLGRSHKIDPADWDKVTGRVDGIEDGHKRFTAYFDVTLHPKDQPARQVKIDYTIDDLQPKGRYGNLFVPGRGDVRGFIVHRKSGEVRFDMTDPRNDKAAFEKRIEAENDEELADVAADPSESITGPPWVVPDECPSCGAKVDRATAVFEEDPHCAYCHIPLPVQPRAQF